MNDDNVTVLNDDGSFDKLLKDSGMTVRVTVSLCTMHHQIDFSPQPFYPLVVN